MGVYLYPSGTETELKNAYIGEYHEWKPDSSRTLYYYEFEQNMNDSSGNWNNMSSSSNYSYVEVWWQYVVQDSWSINLNMPYNSMNTIWTWDFTISFWLYPIVPTNVSNRQPIILAWNYGTFPYPWPNIFFDYYGYWDDYASNPDKKIVWRMERSSDNEAVWWVCSSLINGWHNLVMSRISGVVKCYVDSEQVCQFNSSVNINNTNKSYFIWAASNWSPQWWGTSWAKWDKLIVENVWWSDDQVWVYFNQTKAIYGL